MKKEIQPHMNIHVNVTVEEMLNELKWQKKAIVELKQNDQAMNIFLYLR